MQLEFRLQNSVTGEKTPFADERVRQAVSYAINREEINQVVEAGTGVVGAQPYPPGSPYFVEDLADAYSYDPAKARDLLAEAGYSDGFEFEMAIPGGNIANMQRQGDLIRDQLSQVGITANITPILPQDIANDYYLRKQGDAFSAHELPATFPPNILFSNFGKFQFVAIHDGAERDDITELANEAFGATDPAELASITQDMVRISVEHALDVPIANVSWFAAWDTARVAGTPVAPSSACVPIDLRGVSLK
jgi:peptide/nickel transport system substrate-binding protein